MICGKYMAYKAEFATQVDRQDFNSREKARILLNLKLKAVLRETIFPTRVQYLICPHRACTREYQAADIRIEREEVRDPKANDQPNAQTSSKQPRPDAPKRSMKQSPETIENSEEQRATYSLQGSQMALCVSDALDFPYKRIFPHVYANL
jgi:hypothetical protein